MRARTPLPVVGFTKLRRTGKLVAKLSFLERGNAPATSCKSCGARCIWAETLKGKRVLLDLATEEYVGDDPLTYAYESHFSRCSNADQYRRPR